MNPLDSTVFLLMLMGVPGIGAKSIGAVVRRNALLRLTPGEFLRISPERMHGEYGIRGKSAEVLRAESEVRVRQAEEDARWLSRHRVALLTSQDASYPHRLTQRLDDPPAFLFAHGNLAILERPTCAIAASNGAPESALAAGDRAVESAAEDGRVVVTGHNRPAYQRAALAARRNGGSVCYVLDRGLLAGFGGDLTRALFPAARIWGPAFDSVCDLALSPFPLRSQGAPAANRRRDDLIFALADEIFAAGVRPGGQMERQCRAALARGQRIQTPEGESETGAGESKPAAK